MASNYVCSSKPQKTEQAPDWGTHSWFVHHAKGDANSPGGYFAHRVNGYQRFRHAFVSRFLLAQFPDERLQRIVDIGCAGGDLLGVVCAAFEVESALGIDFVETVVDDAKRRYPQFGFAVASLPDIPVAEASVDLAIASEVLYYLSENDRRRTLEAIFYVLQPGGHLFFTSAVGQKYFTESTACELITPLFEIVKIEYIHSRLYKLVVAHPCRIARFYELISTGGEPTREELRARYNKLRLLFSNRVSTRLLRWAAMVSLQVLRSKALPMVCERIARHFGSRFQGNLMILARRRVNLERSQEAGPDALET